MSGPLLIADHPDGSLRYAYVVADARFTEAAVAGSRMGAILNPFRSEDDARAALIEAGGADVRPA